MADINILGYFVPGEYPSLHQRMSLALMKTGQRIGEMDTMIGAHAAVAGLPLVTHNTCHFSRIPELTLEDWTV